MNASPSLWWLAAVPTAFAIALGYCLIAWGDELPTSWSFDIRDVKPYVAQCYQEIRPDEWYADCHRKPDGTPRESVREPSKK